MGMGMAIPGGLGGGSKPLSRVMFDKYDTDKTGTIDSKKFQMLCYDFGHFMDSTQLVLAIREIDRDGNGTIEYNEFVDWWKKSDRFKALELDDASLEKRKVAAEVFQKFDADSSGSIDKNEFSEFHKHLVNNKLTTKNEADCLSDLDSDRDGKVQFNEYVDWLQRIGTIGQKTFMAK